MKKQLSLLCVLGCFAQPVWAANNVNLANFIGATAQADFKAFSEDLGAALSYKPITPPTPLGITGFDLGLEVTSTKMRNLDIATNSSMNNLVVPKLHIYKGLPLNIDVGAFYSAVPTTNIKFYGGELRYAILEGGVALPAVGIRGALTKLTGVSQLGLTTKSLDVSVSKGFAIFTPYAGIGRVWVDSTPDAATGLTNESFQQGKIYVGGNFNLGVANVALEYDKTGSAPSYSAKLGFRF
ncbi:MAG: hypothetical protein WCB93_02470 [Gallionella sp.]